MDHFSTDRLTAEKLREEHLADLVALRRYKLGIIGFIDNNQRHVGLRQEAARRALPQESMPDILAFSLAPMKKAPVDAGA